MTALVCPVPVGFYGFTFTVHRLLFIRNWHIFVIHFYFVTFQFFKNGDWKQVTVDTLLPFD